MRIPLYFDYACPWAYLGCWRAESYFRDLGVEIDFRPVHLADLRESTGAPRLEMGPRKKKAYLDDLGYWAEMVGAEISLRAKELVGRDTRLALRAALVAKDEGCLRGYHLPAYRARWAEVRDLAERDTVRGLLAGAGLDADAALARAESDEIGERLERDTQQAIERGVFGVPTLFVGERMFWGNDRFELARHFLQKESGA